MTKKPPFTAGVVSSAFLGLKPLSSLLLSLRAGIAFLAGSFPAGWKCFLAPGTLLRAASKRLFIVIVVQGFSSIMFASLLFFSSAIDSTCFG